MPESTAPVLVTGAAGQVGGVGRHVVSFLRASGVPVRAVVRQNDARADRLRDLGAEVVLVDLTKSEEVFPVLQGCKRVFFSTSVSSEYLESTMVMVAAARASTNIELLVNLSQMTVSEMDITHFTGSPQHRLQWLGEQAFNWSGLPVTHLRPTVFQQNPIFWDLAAKSIEKSGTLRMPFGRSRTAPVASKDVAAVAAKILREPSKYAGRVLELTGPRSVDLHGLAEEYSAGLGRTIPYVEVPFDTWRDEMLENGGRPDHVNQHILTMAKLHAAGRYDRYTNSIEEMLGRPPMSISTTIKDDRMNFPIDPAAP